MPNIDMSGSSSGIDYGSFEYQQVESEQFLFADNAGVTNPNVATIVQVEPLRGIGGLSNNEVAELVQLDVHASLEFEDTDGDQDVATAAEHRGTVGINLPESPTAFLASSSNVDPDIDGSIISDDDNVGEDNIAIRARVTSDDNKLLHFRAYGGLPFDDETDGPGGSAFVQPFDRTLNYRQTHGRGPVLDNNDDISIAQTVNVEDTVIPVAGAVRMTMVWDVAETSDAGRAFSVPNDMM